MSEGDASKPILAGDAVLHQEITLDLNADVTEWCPVLHYHNILAAGTYELNEETKTREGLLYLYTLSSDVSSPRLEQQATHKLPGIFDLRWHRTSDKCILAASLADGSVRIFQKTPDDDVFDVAQSGTSQPHPDSMAVSVEFCYWQDDAQTKVAASYSCGSLELFQVTPTGDLTSISRWKAHDLEAWVVEPDRWHPGIIYSGGDDCAFKSWDTRSPLFQEEATTVSIYTNRKAHSAGVCCIASSPYQEHCLITGSYDEHVRVWDTRQLNRPVLTGEVGTGGGVWRLKWHPNYNNKVLAACMHNGFTILSINSDGLESSSTMKQQQQEGGSAVISVIERYPYQQTLGYGASWCAAEDRNLVATASFYDRLLHLWSPASTRAV